MAVESEKDQEGCEENKWSGSQVGCEWL